MTFGPFGVGRIDGKAVMVPHAAPGDLLEVEVVQQRAGYLVARVERVIKAGARAAHRRVRICRAAADAIGSKSLTPEQTRFKAEVIAATLNHALGLELNPATLIEPAPAEFGYRARIRFKTGGGGRLGFYEAGAAAWSKSSIAWSRRRKSDAAASSRPRSSGEEIEVVADRGREVLVAHLAQAARRRRAESRARQLVSATRGFAARAARGRAREVVGEVSIAVALEPGLELEVDADLFSQVNRAQNLQAGRGRDARWPQAEWDARCSICFAARAISACRWRGAARRDGGRRRRAGDRGGGT